MDGRVVSYLRVRDAQRAAVSSYLAGRAPLGEHVEVESGALDARPELARALDTCRLTGATLLVAKLDRLSRDAAFLLNLQKAGVPMVFADMPGANQFMIGVMAMMAQHERELISTRTKAALAVAKARGKRLGGYRGGPVPSAGSAAEARRAKADAFAARVLPTIREMQ